MNQNIENKITLTDFLVNFSRLTTTEKKISAKKTFLRP